MLKALQGVFGLTLRSGTTVDQSDIVHLKQSHQPRFRFEWHRKAQQLYCIDLHTEARRGTSIGNLIGTDLPTHGAAYNAVLIWCRGYRAGSEHVSHNEQGKLILLGDKG